MLNESCGLPYCRSGGCVPGLAHDGHGNRVLASPVCSVRASASARARSEFETRGRRVLRCDRPNHPVGPCCRHCLARPCLGRRRASTMQPSPTCLAIMFLFASFAISGCGRRVRDPAAGKWAATLTPTGSTRSWAEVGTEGRGEEGGREGGASRGYVQLLVEVRFVEWELSGTGSFPVAPAD